MALSTFELAFIFLLLVGVGISIWWFVVALKYRNTLSTFSNARGANVAGKNKTVNMTCDPGKVICVYRATQICSNPGYDGKNFEDPTIDPITNGLDYANSKYGEYSKLTTKSLTKEIGDTCNGKNSCSYLFKGDNFPSPIICHGEPQLISSYTCIQPGTACQASP